MAEARSKKMKYDFAYYLMVSKTFFPANASPKSEDQRIFVNNEERLFHEVCCSGCATIRCDQRVCSFVREQLSFIDGQSYYGIVVYDSQSIISNSLVKNNYVFIDGQGYYGIVLKNSSLQESELCFDYSVKEERDTAMSGDWQGGSGDDEEYDPFRTVMLIPQNKISTIMQKMEDLYGGPMQQ